MTQPVVEIHEVEVHRGSRTILHASRLVVEHHSFLGVVGPNGAGKTTLLGVCAGLVKPTRGEVTVLGKRVDLMSNWQRTNLRRRIGSVPQSTEYNPNVPLTVREIVSLGRVGPRGLFHRLTATDEELVERWIDTLGLAELREQTFRSLSGGEQQKVLIARAMVQEPQILLLDEPASNLDMDWKERVVGLLERLYLENPITVIMVSHETGLLPSCTTQVALLARGEVLDAGPRESVFTSENLTRMYGCPIEILERDGRYHAVAAATKKVPGTFLSAENERESGK